MLKTMAKVFGYVLLLVGILGFIPGITNDGQLLGIFSVNPLHNIIHLITGAIALYAGMASDNKAAKMYFQVFGVIYALVAILGFVVGDGNILGIVANNAADTWLHVVIALVSLYLGFFTKE